MTKLIVTPIDPKATGSHKKRRQLVSIWRQLRDASESNDPEQLIGAYDAIESFLTPMLRTDNGSSVAKALDDVSMEDFDNLLSRILNVSEPAVPPESASS